MSHAYTIMGNPFTVQNDIFLRQRMAVPPASELVRAYKYLVKQQRRSHYRGFNKRQGYGFRPKLSRGVLENIIMAHKDDLNGET